MAHGLKIEKPKEEEVVHPGGALVLMFPDGKLRVS
jgi:hypothetical protein